MCTRSYYLKDINPNHLHIFGMFDNFNYEDIAKSNIDECVRKLALIYTKIEPWLAEAKIDNGHGLDHAMIVMFNLLNAILADIKDGNPNKDIAMRNIYPLCAAALLHDVDDHKFFSVDSLFAENTSRSISTPAEHKLIMEYISDVSYSKNSNTQTKPEINYYVRWADRLESVGAVGYDRCVEYSNFMNRPYCTKNTPIATNEDAIERIGIERNTIYINNGCKPYESDNSTLGHLYDKVLDLKNINTTNSYFKDIMKSRHAYIISVLLNFSNQRLS